LIDQQYDERDGVKEQQHASVSLRRVQPQNHVTA